MGEQSAILASRCAGRPTACVLSPRAQSLTATPLAFACRQLATDLRMEADLLLRRQSPSVAQLWDSSAGAAEKPETQEAQMGNSTTVATSNAQTQQMEARDSTAAAAREPETQELSLHLLPGPIEVHPVQYAVLPG